MPNSKDNPRYNVVSLRVSDEEKAALDEVSQRTHKTLSTVVREAIQIAVGKNRIAVAHIPGCAHFRRSIVGTAGHTGSSEGH